MACLFNKSTENVLHKQNVMNYFLIYFAEEQVDILQMQLKRCRALVEQVCIHPQLHKYT